GDMPADPIDMVVSYSNRAAAKAMTLHLHRLGYRRIAFVGLSVNPRATARQAGFVDALEEAGLPVEARQMVSVSRGFAGGAEAIAYIDKAFPEAEAVFCA